MYLSVDAPGLEDLLVELLLALVDADRKLLLDELQQVDGVDARHGQRVEEEGDGRAGRGRRPAGQEDEACEYGWTVHSGLCTNKVTSQLIDSDSMYGTPLTISKT